MLCPSGSSLGLIKSAERCVSALYELREEILTGAELQGSLLFAIVDIDGNDFGTFLGSCSLQDGQTDTPDTEHGDVGVF